MTMTTKTKTQPRPTPDRDSRYMGLAWLHAGFSKDPSTQVGAQIVSSDNYPLGSGYNGPPRKMRDNEVIWDRPSKEDPDALSKYDLMVHAEINAIKHSCGASLVDSTLYVTAMPCPKCMLRLVEEEIGRIVYFDYQSEAGSMLQNAKWRDKSLRMAQMGGIRMEQFKGNINWVLDWANHMKELGVFGE